jgi:hypothetical protein
MGRIVVTEFVSLDGVMEDPGGTEGFRYGGWSFEIDRGDDGNKFKLDEALEADALLLGRVTYEGFAEAWPSREGEFADKFNSMPKYVVSSTLDQPGWNNTTALGSDVVAGCVEAQAGTRGRHRRPRQRAACAGTDRRQPRRRVAADGVSGRARGGEASCSEAPAPKKGLQLVDSKVVGDGVAVLIYEPMAEKEERGARIELRSLQSSAGPRCQGT